MVPPPKNTAALAKVLTAHQKQTLDSAFQDSAKQRQLSTVLGASTAPLKGYGDDDEDEVTTLGKLYDGEQAASELVSRDVWKALQAPCQSREGRRSKEL